jgi:hypothetical protein
MFIVRGWLSADLNMIFEGLSNAQAVLLSNPTLIPQLQQAFFSDLLADVSAISHGV